MSKTIEKYLPYAAGLAAAYFLLKPKTATPGTTPLLPGASGTSALMSTPPGAPTAPTVFDANYYLTYQYPVMASQNPNITNPNYTLTDQEAQQYINNYYDLQNPPGILNSWGSSLGVSILDKARTHWKQYGVAQKRSFMPFSPINSNQPVLAPPAPATAPSSGGGFFGFLGSLVGLAGKVLVPTAKVATVAGIGAANDIVLTDYEVMTLVTGSAIAFDILPLFKVAGDATAKQAGNIEYTLNHYINQHT